LWDCYGQPPTAFVVVNPHGGAILFSHNCDLKTQPASLTKMMTLFITFRLLKKKVISLDSMIKISPTAAAQKPCKLGLKARDAVSVRNAILAMVTKSANDAAVALAEYLAGGSMPRFVALMNREAKRLKMTSTVFRNPSGWKNPEQLTTARDMAKLSRALMMECPNYYSFFSTKRFYFKKKWYENHNKLLGIRNGIIVDGIKTGFLTASGYNVAISARHGKDKLIVVILGEKNARQRDFHVTALLREGFIKLSRNKKRLRQHIFHAYQSRNVRNTSARPSMSEAIMQNTLRSSHASKCDRIVKSRLFEYIVEPQKFTENTNMEKQR
jgi:D-alanyl-D-alanine carboxypeptidase